MAEGLAMPELLAPAGGMDALRAAVQNGADAVYIGGRAWSARAFAENFGWDEIPQAADYCHLRGVRLYVALNTMLLPGEMDEAVAAARRYWNAGADALIVADMGLARAIGQSCPIPLHASTQMCVHNQAGARLAGEAGFSRVVLARELSLKEIENITGAGGVDTEVFIHGALCSSVSGLCLLSSFIGGRSGNRGKCAQPCRMEYEIQGQKAYHLSMADLCAARMLPQLAACGVKSFKIEGRMKNSGYVGGVVRAYRRILDAALEGKNVPEDAVANLADYYNRTFTCGYLRGETDVTAPDRPNNRNLDKERQQENGGNAERPRHLIDAQVTLEEGKKPALELRCGKYGAAVLGDAELEEAQKPLKPETVARAMEKTGGTPFAARDVQVQIAGSPYISVAALNSLRRDGLAALEQDMLLKWRSRECGPMRPLPEEEHPHSLRDVAVQTGDADMAAQCLLAGASRVYFAPDTYDAKTLAQAEKIEKQAGIKPYIALPPFLRDGDMEYMDRLLDDTNGLFGGALAGNFSQALLLLRYFKNVAADYPCNIANRNTVRAYADMGFTGVTLSAELNKKDINALKGCLETEITAYGYLPLMWLAHPLPQGMMRDRRGYVYSIRRIAAGRELYAILNPVLLAVRELSSIRHSVDAIRLLMDGFEPDILAEYIRAVRAGGDADVKRENTTQGHMKRGV